MQVDFDQKRGLLRFGSWLLRRTLNCEEKLREAKELLARCEISEDRLRVLWKEQVEFQTRPLPRMSIVFEPYDSMLTPFRALEEPGRDSH